MLATIIALPLFGLLVIFQTAIVSRLPLLQGSADVVMLVIIAWALQEQVQTAWQWSLVAGLMVGFVSSLHFSIPLISYLGITWLALAIRRRIWRFPIIIMFLVTFIGTLLNHTLSASIVSFRTTDFPWLEAFQVITLPSLLLNILLAAPIYAIIRDLSGWLYPEEIEI
jgi:hypothetical protein